MKLFRKEEGFTLVELMVVVLIIGILVAIAIPVFNAAKANAQLKSCFANQRTIEGAVQTFLAEGDPNVITDTNGIVTGTHPLLGKFIKDAPKCNATGGSTYFLAAGTVTGDTGAAGWALADGTPHKHF